MFEFTVEVRDKTLARVGQILPEDLNLTVNETFNNVGSWTLVLANGHPMVPTLRTPGAGIIVTRVDTGAVLFSGPVVSPSLEVSTAAPDGTVTISGVSDSVILADRLAYPSPTIGDATAQTSSNDTRTGIAEDLMFAYVDQNIGPSVIPPNILSGDASTFETSIGGWWDSVNAALSHTSAQAHSGTNSLTAVSSTAGDMDAASCAAANITTSGWVAGPGDHWVASAWVRAAVTPRSVLAGLQFFSAAGVSLGTFYGTTITDSTSAWTQVSVTTTAPASTAYVRMHLVWQTAAASETHYADDIVVQRGYGRRDPRLSLGTNGHRGATLTKSPRFQALGALLNEIATIADYPNGTGQPLGFRVVQNGATLQFQTYATNDMSAGVRFDVENGTLASSKVATAAPTVTRTIVGGQGGGTDRLIEEVTSTDSLTAETSWGRRIEQFIDQRQTNDPAQLTAAGNSALAQGGLSQFAMQLTPADDTVWVYGLDYGLGDIVTVVVRDGGGDQLAATELATTVTGYILKADSTGVRFGALLGQPYGDQLAQFSARLSNLETAGATSSGTGTSATLAGLSDVVLTTPSTNDTLSFDGATGKWFNSTDLSLGAPSNTAAVINVARNTLTDDAIAVQGSGDGNGRFFLAVSGQHRWSDGTNSSDTRLYRSAAATLTTDGDFNVAGNLTGAGAPMQRQIFTANGTWTKPAGAKWVRLVALGGGGGGGGAGAASAGNSTHAGGGQAGSYSESYLAASTFSSTATIVIGAGGTGATSAANGGAGGTTTVGGTIVTAPGGNGGLASTTNASVYGIQGGSGATAGTGQLATAGAPGGYGFGGPAFGTGGAGGSSHYGAGGVGGAASTANQVAAGSAATGRGAGGGGGAGAATTSTVANGGAGAGGLVIIDTYF
jgi:hypothetical protein